MHIYVTIDDNRIVTSISILKNTTSTGYIPVDDSTISGNTVTVGSTSVNIFNLVKYVGCLQLDTQSKLAVVPGKSITGDNRQELNTEIPMAFKRANTVVNLGRL